jgi:hypothetical protein
MMKFGYRCIRAFTFALILLDVGTIYSTFDLFMKPGGKKKRGACPVHRVF